MLSIVIIMFKSDRKTISIIIIIVMLGRRTFYNTPTHTLSNACPILINISNNRNIEKFGILEEVEKLLNNFL